MSKKYEPIKLPRKLPSQTWEWFDIVEALNKCSVTARSQWQEKGMRTVSGWAVVAPNGHILPSTFSVSRNTAKRRCLEPAMQKFNGIISSLFREWEKVGYRLVKVTWRVEK